LKSVQQNPDSKDLDPTDAEDSSVEDGKSDEDILLIAKARLQLAEEAETEIRKHALDDLKFRAGEQWPDGIKNQRSIDERPCLVINRLPQFVQQITNDQRQNQPAIKVHPTDSLATEETAKVIQGLIRHIENNSNAEVAYDTAFESAVIGGFGYWRVITGFSDPDSFEQEIFIKRIKNPMSVFLDPYAQEPDASDANWGFVVDDISPDEFKQKYPDALASSMSIDAIWASAPTWVREKNLRIAEYFYKEWTETKIHLLSTGETVRDEDLKQRLSDAATANIQSTVVKSRDTKIPVIKWVKLNGVEILEKTEWLGIYIPIVPVYGAELNVDGERILEGIIRNAKDPQRMYNYWKSAETEAIALAPRAPFIGAEGQFEGHESEWGTANKRNHPYLEYKQTALNGQQAPPPQRQTFEPAIQAITQASMASADDLKATTGIYDAGTGNQGNEQSGVAIDRRNTQVQTANFHFVDNIKRSLRHTGRILVDLIPKIYDTQRASRIIGDDGTASVVMLNGPTGETGKDGKQILYSLDQGRYDAVMDVGPSYASKRQEAANSMMEFTKFYPQAALNVMDLITKNMDWPGAEEMSDRFKKMLPPGLATDDKQQPIPPQAQAQMKQMSQMIQQLSMHLDQKTQIIQQKQIETDQKKMVLEHDERIELAKIQADIEINMAKLGTQSSIALLQQEVATLQQREKILGMSAPLGSDDPALNPNFGGQPAGGSSAVAGQPPQQPTGGQSPGQTLGNNP
jgi:hypothetical protein